MRFLLALILLLAVRPLHAGPITADEFAALARDLAPKVNLFSEVWRIDPTAEFFGGTSRDYLYWIKGQLNAGKTPEQLRALTVIDVRSFITGESDADILSSHHHLSHLAQRFGLKKIDTISTDRLDPTSEMGKTELRQGYLPVEKIRLGRQGVVESPAFGSGLKEIFTGNLTVHFAPDKEFDATFYAKKGQNHPVLLALRYLRLLAMDYYYSHGRGYPPGLGTYPIDAASEKAAREVIAKAVTDGTLAKLLEKPEFAVRLNNTVHKAFRTYTNPTAALLFFQRFGADKLVNAYRQIEPINQYLFAKYHDPEEIRANFEKYRVKREAFFSPASAYFPDGNLYHGTRNEQAFRNIILTGILPSQDGSGGAGLYGVGLPHLNFAQEWGGDPNRVVFFGVKATAKIVDITTGEGRRIFRAFGGSEDEFAAAFGVDIVRYPYGETTAFVVKNSEALNPPQGHTRQVLPLQELVAVAEKVSSQVELEHFLRTVEINSLTSTEIVQLARKIPYRAFADVMADEPLKGLYRLTTQALLANLKVLPLLPGLKAEAAVAMPGAGRPAFLRKLLDIGLPAYSIFSIVPTNTLKEGTVKAFAHIVDDLPSLEKFCEAFKGEMKSEGEASRILRSTRTPGLDKFLQPIEASDFEFVGAYAQQMEAARLFAKAPRLKTEAEARAFVNELGGVWGRPVSVTRGLVKRMPDSLWKARLERGLSWNKHVLDTGDYFEALLELHTAIEELAEAHGKQGLAPGALDLLTKNLDEALERYSLVMRERDPIAKESGAKNHTKKWQAGTGAAVTDFITPGIAAKLFRDRLMVAEQKAIDKRAEATQVMYNGKMLPQVAAGLLMFGMTMPMWGHMNETIWGIPAPFVLQPLMTAIGVTAGNLVGAFKALRQHYSLIDENVHPEEISELRAGLEKRFPELAAAEPWKDPVQPPTPGKKLLSECKGLIRLLCGLK